jgi:hypothetical protein
MRNAKKWIALVTAATMVVAPMSVFADTITGNGIVETDNSEDISYSKVELPTIPSGTYDFKLDPNTLLSQYDSETYVNSATLLFHRTASVAKIAAADDNDDGSLYYIDTVEDTSFAKLTAAVTLVTGTGAVSAIDGNFYVWAPKSGSDYEGEYLALTKDNITKYFTFTANTSDDTKVDSVAATGSLANGVVSDGKAYTDGYVAVTNEDVTLFGTISKNATTKEDEFTVGGTGKKDLYTTADQSTYTKVDASNQSTKLAFTPAVTDYSNTSDELTIVNKATADTTVGVDITVSGVKGLTFGSSSSLSAGSSIYLAVTDGQTPAYAAADSEGNVKISTTYEIPAIDEDDAITYQTTEYDEATGSHIYKKYEAPNAATSSVTLKLEGGTLYTGNEDEWDTYIDAMTKDTKPSISVVYTLTNDAAPSALELTKASNGNYTYTFDASSKPTGTISAITFNGTAKNGQITQGNVTYNATTGKLVINATAAGNLTSGANTIVATIGGTDYTFTATK